MKLKTIVLGLGVVAIAALAYEGIRQPGNALAMKAAGGGGGGCDTSFIAGQRYVAQRAVGGGYVYDVVINKVLRGSFADQETAEQTYNFLVCSGG